MQLLENNLCNSFIFQKKKMKPRTLFHMFSRKKKVTHSGTFFLLFFWDSILWGNLEASVCVSFKLHNWLFRLSRKNKKMAVIAYLPHTFFPLPACPFLNSAVKNSISDDYTMKILPQHGYLRQDGTPGTCVTCMCILNKNDGDNVFIVNYNMGTRKKKIVQVCLAFLKIFNIACLCGTIIKLNLRNFFLNP